jgi:hypothetical protein
LEAALAVTCLSEPSTLEFESGHGATTVLQHDAAAAAAAHCHGVRAVTVAATAAARRPAPRAARGRAGRRLVT